MIQVLAGAYPDHSGVVVTAITYSPGALRCKPIAGCYAIAYPSMDQQYPLVPTPPAVMSDPVAEGLMDDCRVLAEHMAYKAWQLIRCGEAHLIAVRTRYGLALPRA